MNIETQELYEKQLRCLPLGINLPVALYQDFISAVMPVRVWAYISTAAYEPSTSSSYTIRQVTRMNNTLNINEMRIRLVTI
jgi:hypothetical protein